MSAEHPVTPTVLTVLTEIEQQEAAMQQRLAELRRIRADLLPLLGATDLVPLKEAVARTGIPREAMLKRAQRGAAVKRDGRWYFTLSWVDEHSRKMSTPECPDVSTIRHRRSARV